MPMLAFHTALLLRSPVCLISAGIPIEGGWKRQVQASERGNWNICIAGLLSDVRVLSHLEDGDISGGTLIGAFQTQLALLSSLDQYVATVCGKWCL